LENHRKNQEVGLLRRFAPGPANSLGGPDHRFLHIYENFEAFLLLAVPTLADELAETVLEKMDFQVCGLRWSKTGKKMLQLATKSDFNAC
jgi:hypothetical protein